MSAVADSGESNEGSEAVPDDATKELAQRSRPFLALFGSAAAVSTFLLFAGFLSDYGVYQLLGLPRLSFSLTALVEAGADTLIDTLALLFQGMRLGVLLLGLAGLALVWAHHEHPRLQPWARCRHLHSLAWFLVFLFSLFLLASLVDRAQRSLRGDMYQPPSVSRALLRAYADGFPDPEARRYALEREGFELNYYPLPNLVLTLEDKLNPPKDDSVQGIALRVLPQSRADARHIYGWLVLSVIGLLMALLVLRWWLDYLKQQESASAGLPQLASGSQTVDPLPTWMQWWARRRLGREMAPVIQRLLSPLVWLILAASILMLPLLHGVLARQSLGGQTMMVYLRPDGPAEKKKTKTVSKTSERAGREESEESESEEQVSEPSEMAVAKARFDCSKEGKQRLELAFLVWQQALRDAVQARFGSETSSRMLSSLEALAEQVIKSNCAEAVHTFRAAKPAAGLLAQSDQLAQAYRQAQLRVNSSYQVHQGVILAHPRDGQPLMLVENVVPRTDEQQGQWSVWAVPQDRVLETVVVPDVLERTVSQAAQAIRQAPDKASAQLQRLLTPMHPGALRALLPLTQEGKLNANASGVATSALGGMVRASALDQPELAARGINWLSSAAAPQDTAASAPESGHRHQGAAVTSLHLSDDPFAAHKLAQMLKPPFDMARCREFAVSQPLHCIPQSTTTAGYLLAALGRERQLMQAPSQRLKTRKPQYIPDSLNDSESKLQALLIAYIDDPKVPDDWRGAACSIVEQVAGALMLDAKQADRFLKLLAPEQLAERAFSAGACISASKRLGLPSDALRSSLRQLALAQTTPTSLQPGEFRRFRQVALMTLFEMGLANEDEFMLKLIMQALDRDMRDVLHQMLSEVEGQPMAKGLLRCALDEQQSRSVRANCLQAFSHLDQNYSGDEGLAKQLLAWTKTQQDAALKVHACTALQALHARNGKFLRRQEGEDATLDQCLKLAQSRKDGEDDEGAARDAAGLDPRQLARIRQLLDAMKSKAGKADG